MSTFPVICHADGQRFSVASLTDDLRCACGSDDLDLDDGHAPFETTASWETDQAMDRVDDTASVKQKVTCSTCFTEATVTATDPAQPMPPCPNCGAETLSPAGSTLASRKQASADNLDWSNGWASLAGHGQGPSEWGTWSTADGTIVKAYRKGQKVRFYDADGNQHGPEQSNVAPAFAYAEANGWFNADSVKHRFKDPRESNLRVRDDVPARRISVREQTGRTTREAKVAEIVAGIRATNPSIDPRQARRVAEETVRRFPQVDREALPKHQTGWEHGH